MKYLVWKESSINGYDDEYDDEENHIKKERHCDCTCCGICSKYYKSENLNVLCTGSSYAEFFGGNVPKDPIHKITEMDQRKYMITRVACIENDMIEVSAKKVDWRKEVEEDYEV